MHKQGLGKRRSIRILVVMPFA